MAFIDFIILLLAIWAVYRGWRAGFLKEIISMIGFFVGLFLAAALYSNFGEYLAPKIGASPGVSDVIAFILIWVVVPILLGMVANILTKALKGMKLGLPNSILGAALSTMKYLVLMSCIFKCNERNRNHRAKRPKTRCFTTPSRTPWARCSNTQTITGTTTQTAARITTTLHYSRRRQDKRTACPARTAKQG